MLAGNMGRGAQNVLEHHHIQVVRGCSGPVEEVVADWLQGKITDSGDSCGHHDCPEHAGKTLTFKVR